MQHFALETSKMGREAVLLLLLPPEALATMSYRARWVDTFNSHLLEVGRCFTDGKILRSARFWYEPRTFRGGAFGTKPEEFVGWATSIFQKTKKLLRRRPVPSDGGRVRTEWFSAEAWEAVAKDIWRLCSLSPNMAFNRTRAHVPSFSRASGAARRLT